MALGTNHVASTELATFTPELWSNEIVASYESNLIMANLFRNMNHQNKKGDTIHIPSPVRGNASDKTAENAVSFIANNEGEVTISIDQHAVYGRAIEDFAAKQAIDSYREFYTEDAGYAIARHVDDNLWTLVGKFQGGTGGGTYDAAVIGSDGSTTWDPTANTNTGNGQALTDAGIREMIQTLDDNDVPMTGRYMGIPPVERKNLMGLSRFTEQAFVGENADSNVIRNGRLGNVYGVEIYVTTNSPTITANDTSTEYRVGGMWQKDAAVLATQQDVRVQTQYDLEYLTTMMVSDMIYGFEELRDEGGVAFVVPK